MLLPSPDESGVAVARGAILPFTVRWLRQVGKRLYELVDGTEEPASSAEKELQRSFLEWGGLCLLEARTLLYERDDAASGVLEALLDHLRPHWRYCFYRLLMPEKVVGVPWHIDAEAASTMLLDNFGSTTSAWLPLTSVGTDSPSLEVIPGSSVLMRSEHLEPARHRDTGWVDALGLPSISPALVPGDVIVFDQYTLHRTQQIPVTRPRLTCELRYPTK